MPISTQRTEGTTAMTDQSQSIPEPETDVRASLEWHGQQLTDVPVINPGDWFGRCWLLEIGGSSYSSFYLIAEADSATDAIDELAESKWGFHIAIPEEDIADYGYNVPHYSGQGIACDLEYLEVYGQDGYSWFIHEPIPGIRYFGRYAGHELPTKGIRPKNLGDWYRWIDG